jgi:hypothetical protein
MAEGAAEAFEVVLVHARSIGAAFRGEQRTADRLIATSRLCNAVQGIPENGTANDIERRCEKESRPRFAEVG